MAYFAVTNSTVFAGSSQFVMTATYQTQALIASASGILNPPVRTGLTRGRLYDWVVGTNTAPADTYIEWEIVAATVGSTMVWLGSVSSVSSGLVLDQADAGPMSFVAMNSTVETNVAATFQRWYFGMNQRASYRYVCPPGGELVWPAVSSATGSNGLAMKARGTYTGTGTVTMYALEL